MVASIFYHQLSWHELMTGVIDPFIRQHKENISSWNLHLGTLRGDHVTIVIMPGSFSDDTLTRLLSEQVTKFLEEDPSAIKLTEYQKNSLFMDYPANSIEFDVEKPFVFSVGTQRLVERQQQLSEIILEYFSDQEIDIDNTYTFLIYLQLGIIRTAYPDIRRARSNAGKLERFVNTKKDEPGRTRPGAREEDIQRAVTLLEQNKPMFIELIEDLWDPAGYDPELQWMEKWEDLCRDTFQETDFFSAYMLLTNMIYSHMGLPEDRIQMKSSKQFLKIFTRVTKNMISTIRIA